MASLSVRIERFPIRGTFTIARGSKTEAVVVVAEITAAGLTGRGECVPYARYGESVEGVADAVSAMAGPIAAGLDRIALQARMPAGAARNALDCALWDLEAKRRGIPAFRLAGLDQPRPLTTAFTLSLDSAEAMAAAALEHFQAKWAPLRVKKMRPGNKLEHLPDSLNREDAPEAGRPLLKLKLGAPGDAERLKAIRAAVPGARLIVDANEGWSADALPGLLAACAGAGVELVEQPLPAADDAALAALPHPVPVCADESVHDRHGLAALRARYDAVNIKLDKTGGLTEALAMAAEARAAGFRIMVGCMLGSSLAMAPALLVAQGAEVVDLDGPLLLARDRVPGLAYDGATVYPPEPALWG